MRYAYVYVSNQLPKPPHGWAFVLVINILPLFAGSRLSLAADFLGISLLSQCLRIDA
jgi:hypothetical protein